MANQDEKKPPVGGRVNIAQIRSRHQVVGRLLAAREELLQAIFLARQRGYSSAAQMLENYAATELQALFEGVMPLLEQTEDPQDYEARLRSGRPDSGSGATQP